MPRTAFDLEMKHLQEKLISLGEMVKDAILQSIEILKRRDMKEARRFIARDAAINEVRYAIENDAIVAIAKHQPMAVDLRTLASVLEIAIELERIGDYAKGIAKITIKLGEEPLMKPLVDIPRMAEKAVDMLQRSLKSFAERDVALAKAIPAEDKEMDALYNQIYRELVTYILCDPKAIEQSNYLIWVAHNLERAADRVVNICERVVFTVTGEMMEMDGNSLDELDDFND